MFSVNQSLIYGRTIPADKHVSDAMMAHKLAGKTEDGKVPVYGEHFFNNPVIVKRKIHSRHKHTQISL
jgi:hypothetical protein